MKFDSTVLLLTLIEKSVFEEYLVNANTFSKYLHVNTNANTFHFKSSNTNANTNTCKKYLNAIKYKY